MGEEGRKEVRKKGRKEWKDKSSERGKKAGRVNQLLTNMFLPCRR